MRTARLLTISQHALHMGGVYLSMYCAGECVYPSMHWEGGCLPSVDVCLEGVCQGLQTPPGPEADTPRQWTEWQTGV